MEKKLNGNNEEFRYEDTKKFVSYFDNKTRNLDTVDLKKKNKKKFNFLKTNDNKAAAATAAGFQRQHSPLFTNKYEKDTGRDDTYVNFQSKSKLLTNLEDKLFAIAAGIMPAANSTDEIYSTTKKIADGSLNTLSTQLNSDSSANNSMQTKMITFTSANSLENEVNESSSRIQLSTFSPNCSPNNNIYSTIKQIKAPDDSAKLSPIKNSQDSHEAKFLSNLCEIL